MVVLLRNLLWIFAYLQQPAQRSWAQESVCWRQGCGKNTLSICSGHHKVAWEDAGPFSSVLSNLAGYWPGLILGILEVPKPIMKGSRFQKIVFGTVVQFSLRRGAVNALRCLLGIAWLARMPELLNQLALHSQHTSGTEVLHPYASTELQSRFKYFFYICFKCE